MPPTNDHRVSRYVRISNLGALAAYVGLVLLGLLGLLLLGGAHLPPVLGPLGMILTLLGGFASMAFEQLADRYRESDEIA